MPLFVLTQRSCFCFARHNLCLLQPIELARGHHPALTRQGVVIALHLLIRVPTMALDRAVTVGGDVGIEVAVRLTLGPRHFETVSVGVGVVPTLDATAAPIGEGE